MNYHPVFETTRGGIVESVHFGAIAVVNRSGCLIAHYGSPEVQTFSRSSAKPIQILPFLEAQGREHFGLSLKQIAIMCASHAGTDEHFNTVSSIQQLIGIDEKQLMCGFHPPIDRLTAERMHAAGESPTQNRHNCSGKHSGMLAYTCMLAADRKTYLEPEHPVQREILSTYAAMCQVAPQSIAIGIDGCSAPVFGTSLQAVAQAYASLVDPVDLSPGRAQACRTVFSAMTGHPDMVAGPGQFDTRLMEVTGGRLVSKGGAEGFRAIGIPAGVLSPESQGIGITLKISDGDLKHRANSLVTLEILRQLGAIDATEAAQIVDPEERLVKNWRGIPVGKMMPAFTLEFE